HLEVADLSLGRPESRHASHPRGLGDHGTRLALYEDRAPACDSAQGLEARRDVGDEGTLSLRRPSSGLDAECPTEALVGLGRYRGADSLLVAGDACLGRIEEGRRR